MDSESIDEDDDVDDNNDNDINETDEREYEPGAGVEELDLIDDVELCTTDR